MKRTKIKILLIVVSIVVITALLPSVYVNLRSVSNSDVLDDLKGEIYITDSPFLIFKSLYF
jgi:hypothetical protein